MDKEMIDALVTVRLLEMGLNHLDGNPLVLEYHGNRLQIYGSTAALIEAIHRLVVMLPQ